jgi:thioredoxin-like negative regulator of GroEL
MKRLSWEDRSRGVAALAVLSLAGLPVLAGCGQQTKAAAPAAPPPAPADATPAAPAVAGPAAPVVGPIAETNPDADIAPPAAQEPVAPLPPTTVGSAKMPWVKSWDVALKQAKATGRPIFIDFYTDWCGWCKQLDRTVYTDPQVVKVAADFVPVKLNAEGDGADVAQKYRAHISGFPTILFVNAEGKVEGKIGGYLPAPRFAETMGQLLAMHREIPVLKRNFASDPNDLKSAAKLTAVFAQQDDLPAAAATLDRVMKLDPANEQGYLAKSAILVGQMRANRNDFKQALPLFQKAVQVARTPEDAGYGRLNIAVSYLAQKDLKSAKTELQATADDPKVDDQSKEKAKTLLARIDQAEQQQPGG